MLTMIQPAGLTGEPPPAGFAVVSSGAPLTNPLTPVLGPVKLIVPGPNGPTAP